MTTTPTPPFDRHLITLRLRRRTTFHFNHGGVVQGALRAALRSHNLPEELVPFACESGRVRFEPGDSYRIGVTLVGESRKVANALIDGLRSIGAKAQEAGPRATLAGNFEVVDAEQLPPPDLQRECSAIAGDSVTLRFLSPLRLERPRNVKSRGAAYVNADCFPADHFLLRLWQRIFRLAHGRYPSEEERIALAPRFEVNPVSRDRFLTWLDVPVKGLDDERRPKGYTVGGVVGRVTFANVDRAWAGVVVLGQYLHAGANTHYGLGRYAIDECRATIADDPFRPARTMRDDLANRDLLAAALRHVEEQSVAAGIDGVPPSEESSVHERLPDDLAAALARRSYAPSSLLGIIGRKKDGGLRPLTIPTVDDRVVQRAAVELLAPSIETLLEDCSYAYRKGFSRAGAARAIQQAYEDGFRYVLDADITAFFDAVPWDRLFAKVESLFPFDPIVDLLRAWSVAPVVFEGRTIRRDRGLPQGSAVSPLLANLYLDELDEELLGRDYRLIRYADDFVILCRSVEEATRARDDARAALQRLGLALNEAKTGVRDLDAGFTYLGYLFCRSVAIDQEGDEPLASVDLEAPRHSWLAAVPLERIRALVADPKPAASKSARPIVRLAPLADHAVPDKRPVYVTVAGARLRVEQDRLAIALPGEEAHEVPVRLISHLVCARGVGATLPLLLELNANGVPVFFCHADGELFASFAPHAPDWSLWRSQAEMAEREEVRVAFAREIVAAKLHNAAALVVRFDLDGGADIAGELRALERSCENKSEIESLLGLEGKGAALFFGAFSRSLGAEWGFTTRRRRPPPDPVNAMLSYGYTMLYHHCATAVIAEGLHPRIGLYHREKGAYEALACDLEEELRYLVDSFVWSLVSRREATLADFVDRGGGTILLTPAFRRRFVQAFQRRMLDEFTPEGEDDRISYLAFLARQARRLRGLVTGAMPNYRALRVHS